MSDVTLKAELGLVSYDDVQSAALTMCPTGHALHHTERFQHLVQTTSVSSCGDTGLQHENLDRCRQLVEERTDRLHRSWPVDGEQHEGAARRCQLDTDRLERVCRWRGDVDTLTV